MPYRKQVIFRCLLAIWPLRGGWLRSGLYDDPQGRQRCGLSRRESKAGVGTWGLGAERRLGAELCLGAAGCS